MAIGRVVLSGFLLCIAGMAGAGPAGNETELPPSYMPTGQQMYSQYCAACHGADAKGHGPLAVVLKTPPADLSTLAIRHQGKFPYDYVSSVLEFGPGFPAHGSSEMPTWGPIFRYYDKRNEKVVKQRIRTLGEYLASLQVSE
jgi:mono/diheme cytochrome c family protein